MNFSYRNNQNTNKNMQNYHRRFPNYYEDNPVTYQRNGNYNNDDFDYLPGQRPMPPFDNQMPGRMPPFNNQRQTPPMPPRNNQIPGRMPPFNDQMPGRMPPFTNQPQQPEISVEDQGPNPFSTNISELAENNLDFRQTLWTGEYLQVTIMSIEVGGEIGYEIHPDFDQFLYIEEGEGLVVMGDSMDNLDYQESVYDGYAVIIPAGEYHNLINEGNVPIKLFSVYAPPAHPYGTVHETFEEAMEDDEN